SLRYLPPSCCARAEWTDPRRLFETPSEPLRTSSGLSSVPSSGCNCAALRSHCSIPFSRGLHQRRCLRQVREKLLSHQLTKLRAPLPIQMRHVDKTIIVKDCAKIQ